MTHTECRRCLLPAGKLHVQLDDSGLCNYCRHWEATKAEVLDRFPAQSAEFFSGRDVARGVTGETFPQVRGRMRNALTEIAAQYPGETIGVVSHGGATRAWVTEVLGLPYEHRNRLSILGNTGYARIVFGRRGPSVLSWNLAPHLESE